MIACEYTMGENVFVNIVFYKILKNKLKKEDWLAASE